MHTGKRIRIGVAGLGRIGAIHAANISGRVPHADLALVVDARAERAREIGEQEGVAWSTEWSDILVDPEIDAIVIATPTPTHPELVRQAAAAGKAIFCEKPLALTEEETRAVLQDVERAGVPLQVGLHRRFDPDTRRTKELIDAGELGSLYSLRTSLRDMAPQPMEYIRESGSFFVDVSIHDLDVARWLLGEIDEVNVIGASVSDPTYAEIGTVDLAAIVLRFASGALGLLDNSRIAGYGYESAVEVVGSAATVRIENSQKTHVKVLKDLTARSDYTKDFVERFEAAYLDEMVDFVAALREGRQVGVTGWDALAAFVLGEACEKSFQTGVPVRLEHDLVDGNVQYRVAGEPN